MNAASTDGQCVLERSLTPECEERIEERINSSDIDDLGSQQVNDVRALGACGEAYMDLYR